MRMERVGSGSIECSEGSRACDIGNCAEVFSIRSDGNVEGKDSDQDVSEISGDEEEAVLGESFLGERVLCEHDRVGRGEDKKYVQYQEEEERQEESQQQEFGF